MTEIKLTVTEEKFYNADGEIVPIVYLTNRGFISKLRKHKPRAIFVVNEPRVEEGHLSVWFIDRIRHRRLETDFHYLTYEPFGLRFDKVALLGPLEGLLMDILKNEDKYSKFSVSAVDWLQEYIWKIPWSLVLEKKSEK